MTITVTPLHRLFVAEISGADLARPLAAAELDQIRRTLDTCGVGVFHAEYPLADEAHIAFSRLLGPIDVTPVFKVTGRRPRLPFRELQDVSNLDETGRIQQPDSRVALFRKGDRLWHTDMSFHENRATFSALSAHVVPPEGGDTEFADMRAAYAALPEGMKARIDGLVAEHSIWHSRRVAGFPEPTEEELASRPPVHHPLVHRHRGSGRKALYLAAHASHIVGWPVEEGRALLAELMALATRPDFVYRHRWTRGDLVIWDNLCTMHRGTPFPDTIHRRDMRRTTMRERAAA